MVDSAPVDDEIPVVTVQRGDTLSKLAHVQYADAVDRGVIGWLADVNDLDDPNLIFPGQELRFPPIGTQPTTSSAAVSGDASWITHTTVNGDTVWDIIEARYGVVNGDMVWTVSDLNQLENPNEIDVGMNLVLPPMGSDGILVAEQLTLPETATPPVVDVDEASVDVVTVSAETNTRLPPDVAPEIPVDDVADVDDEPDVVEAPADTKALAVPAVERVDEPASVDTAVVTVAPVAEAETELSGVPMPPIEDPSAAVSVAAVGRWASALPWAGAGAGTLLTLAGLISWRRRRRRGELVTVDDFEVDVAPLHRFDTLVDLPLAEWAAAGLATLEHVDATLMTAMFGTDGLSVVWSSPLEATAPWIAVDDATWMLDRAVALAPTDAGYHVAGFPLLVTVGRRDDQHVLVNLAAFSPLSIRGVRAEELVGSIIAELATGGDVSDGLVRAVDVTLPDFVDFDRVRSVSSTQLLASTPSPAGRPMLTVVDAAHSRIDEIVGHADSVVGDAVIVLGDSELCEATLDVSPDAAILEPSNVSFVPAMAPVIVERTRTTSPASAVVEVDESAEDWKLDDDEEQTTEMTSPVQPLLLRVFSPRLPSIDPRIDRLGDSQIRVLAALDSFGGVSQTPDRLAERLNVSAKTVRTYGSALRTEELPLVESDGKTWSLTDIVTSDVAWIEQRADAARRHPERHGVVMNLGVVWEMLERITGPAYGAAAGSKEWAWVFDHEEPPCPADVAWNRLCSSVQTAVEVWDKLAVERDDDIISTGTVISLLVRAEKAIGHPEPWPLLRAAAIAARRGSESGRQQIALRLAQLAADGTMVPGDLVDEVVD